MAWRALNSKSFGNNPTKVSTYSDKDLLSIIDDKIDLQLAGNRKIKILEFRLTELENENKELLKRLDEIIKTLNKDIH